MDVAGLKQKRGSHDTAQATVAILKRMDRQEDHCGYGGTQQRMQWPFSTRLVERGQKLRHAAWGVGGRRGFEDNADHPAVRVGCTDIVAQGLVATTMACVLVAM